MKPRVMIYCQHVLGMGHLVRSLEIVKALTDCDVLFFNGGERLAGLDWPSLVRVVDLPPIVSDDRFDGLHAVGSTQSLEVVQRERTSRLLAGLHDFRPHVFLVELFPFGRLRFAFELLPVLARIRLDRLPTRVVCSLRDILVSKSDPIRHEEWVCSLMNRYFDGLLVHADPAFQTLNETFSRVAELTCPIHYTGFVAEPSPPDSPGAIIEEPWIPHHEDSPRILVSIGGGRVGYELIEGAIRAVDLLRHRRPCRLALFTGPYLPPDQWESLVRLVEGKGYISLRRYTNRFLWYLKQADVSLSMAGYNTCMNLLTTKTKALVLPFTGRGNEEQTIRAQKLERLGLVNVLSQDELSPAALAARLDEALASREDHPGIALNLRGAQETARLIRKMAIGLPTSVQSSRESPVRRFSEGTRNWKTVLHNALESVGSNEQPIHLFLRDDDIDSDEETLRTLTDITLSQGVPLNLEIIPGCLTPRTIRFLKNLKRIDPALIELNQHGWRHLNHEKEGRKCEFGPSRSFEDQYHDIAKGKRVLEDALEERFHPVFTPPWNRCTPDTFKVLDQLQFRVLSKDRGARPISGYGFREVSTSLDLYRWKEDPKLKDPDEIVQALITQFAGPSPIGLLLHHKVMDQEAFLFLDNLLQVLRAHPHVRLYTFERWLHESPSSTLLTGASA